MYVDYFTIIPICQPYNLFIGPPNKVEKRGCYFADALTGLTLSRYFLAGLFQSHDLHLTPVGQRYRKEVARGIFDAAATILQGKQWPQLVQESEKAEK